MRWVRTSVSVSERNSTPSASSLRAQVGGVVDDAVVDDGDLALGVQVRVGVHVGGGAVGGPAGVGDAGGALEARGDLGLQVADAALGLDHLQAGRLRASVTTMPAES